MPVLKQHDVFAGRYLLDQLLGDGGFSEVWKARDLMANEAVIALKIYAPDQGLDEWGLQQFKNEFSLTHNLSHPHLLKVNHFDVAEGAPYLTMTYCPYGSLGQGLRQAGTYSEREVALVMCQIGSALEEIHRQEPAIIHQDIKPDNILLLQPETYMLADFGISSTIRTTLSRTTFTAQALTLAYAPPERFDYHPTASAASDIFSLGVSLYEMCTATVPWEGAGGQCLLKGARVPALPAGYSPALSAILEACMSAEPGKRPTAADIHQMGSYYLETGQWQASRKQATARFRSTATIAALATAGVAMVAFAGVAFYELEPSKPAEEPAEQKSALVVTERAEQESPSESVNSSPARQITPAEKPASASTKQAPATGRQHAKKPVPLQPKSSRAQNSQQKAQPVTERVMEISSPGAKALESQAPLMKPATAETKPAAEAAHPRPGTSETKAASQPTNSSPAKVNRPSTSNTSMPKTKKPLFDLRPKAKSSLKKNPHQKRVKKLQRRFS